MQFLILLALFFYPQAARAWGGDGHRIVCALAWEELKTPARHQVEDILGVRTGAEFADTCNWADEYRPTHPETAAWHFVNVPHGATSIDLARDCQEPKSCVVIQIERQLGILESNAPKEERANALKFVGHFVGDIHQPLHSGYAEDRGGNRIRGEFMGKKMDMHELWDAALIASEHRPWAELARSLRARATPQKRRVWIASEPLAWANESLAIDLAPRTKYDEQSKGFIWGAEYAHENVSIVNDRLSRAGVRLGYLLNEAMGK